MRRIEISIGFLEQDGAYLLQRRAPHAALGAAGLTGAFGGQIELGESPLEAVCREVGEETSLNPSTEDFRYLGALEVISDRDHEPVQICAEVYIHAVPANISVKAFDGELVRITRAEADLNPDSFTPATKEAFRMYL
jgi:8-oxo-dGTP pyrophosphatase MutT (NUDIX family)